MHGSFTCSKVTDCSRVVLHRQVVKGVDVNGMPHRLDAGVAKAKLNNSRMVAAESLIVLNPQLISRVRNEVEVKCSGANNSMAGQSTKRVIYLTIEYAAIFAVSGHGARANMLLADEKRIACPVSDRGEPVQTAPLGNLRA